MKLFYRVNVLWFAAANYPVKKGFLIKIESQNCLPFFISQQCLPQVTLLGKLFISFISLNQ